MAYMAARLCRVAQIVCHGWPPVKSVDCLGGSLRISRVRRGPQRQVDHPRWTLPGAKKGANHRVPERTSASIREPFRLLYQLLHGRSRTLTNAPVCVHTEEVTGSIPVSPTSKNESGGRSPERSRSPKGSLTLSGSQCREDLGHHLGALSQNRTQLLAIHSLGDRRTRMADEPGYHLNRHAVG